MLDGILQCSKLCNQTLIKDQLSEQLDSGTFNQRTNQLFRSDQNLLHFFGVIRVLQNGNHNKNGLAVEIQVEISLNASDQRLSGFVKDILVFFSGGLQVLEELFGQTMSIVAEEELRLYSSQLASVADTVEELLVELFEVLVVFIVLLGYAS